MRTTAILLLVSIAAVMAQGAPGTMYVDAAAGGAGNGTTWAQAWNSAQFLADTPEAGDIYYVRGGTYTGGASLDWSALHGTAASPIQIIGVKVATTAQPPTASDYATLDARPLFDFDNGAYSILLGNYWVLRNLRTTTNSTSGLYLLSYGYVHNCKMTGIGGATTPAARNGTSTHWVQCEATNASGRGFQCNGGGVLFCHAHDCAAGIYIAGSNPIVANSIVADCAIGVNLNDSSNMVFLQNTWHNCTTTFSGGTAYACVFLNNLVDGATTEATWTSAVLDNFWDYQLWEATPTLTNVTAGRHDVTTDVTLNADYTVPAACAALSVGAVPDVNVGLTTPTHLSNIGVDQDQNVSAPRRWTYYKGS